MQRGDRRNRRGTFSSFAKENLTIFGTAKNDCGVQTEVHTHRPTSVALQNCTCLPVVITRLNKSSFSSISCDVGQIPFRYVFCSWSCLFHSNTYFLKVIQRRFATSFSISRWCLKLNLCVATVIFYRFRDIATYWSKICVYYRFPHTPISFEAHTNGSPGTSVWKLVSRTRDHGLYVGENCVIVRSLILTYYQRVLNRPANIDLHTAWRRAQNRPDWRTFVRTATLQ